MSLYWSLTRATGFYRNVQSSISWLEGTKKCKFFKLSCFILLFSLYFCTRIIIGEDGVNENIYLR